MASKFVSVAEIEDFIKVLGGLKTILAEGDMMKIGRVGILSGITMLIWHFQIGLVLHRIRLSQATSKIILTK
jgi:hypothetical protein